MGHAWLTSYLWSGDDDCKGILSICLIIVVMLKKRLNWTNMDREKLRIAPKWRYSWSFRSQLWIPLKTESRLSSGLDQWEWCWSLIFERRRIPDCLGQLILSNGSTSGVTLKELASHSPICRWVLTRLMFWGAIEPLPDQPCPPTRNCYFRKGRGFPSAGVNCLSGLLQEISWTLEKVWRWLNCSWCKK